jgi:hypothetical protein
LFSVTSPAGFHPLLQPWDLVSYQEKDPIQCAVQRLLHMQVCKRIKGWQRARLSGKNLHY